MIEFIHETWGFFVVLLAAISLLYTIIRNHFEREKGYWARVRPENLPNVVKKFKEARAFMDHDGMSKDVTMYIRYHSRDNSYTYHILVPKHVIPNISHKAALDLLGLTPDIE